MSKKNIDDLLKEAFENEHKEISHEKEDLYQILKIATEAIELEREYRADTETPKLEVKIYSNRAKVEYNSERFEHRALAAKSAIAAILSSINDKSLREGIIAFACKETNTFDD